MIAGPSRSRRTQCSAEGRSPAPFLMLAATLLFGCATPRDLEPPVALLTKVQDTEDFQLTRPRATLEGDNIILEGALCRRYDSIALSPHRILVIGYDPAHHRLFQVIARLAPLIVRTDDTCHGYRAKLPASPKPSEVEVRAIPYGERTPP